MGFIDGTSLGECYGHLYKDLKAVSHTESVVNASNVFQQGNEQVLKIFDGMLEDCLLEGSGFLGEENINAFMDAVRQGKRALIVMEHYSNYDLPAFCHLLRKSNNENAQEIAKRLIAIAGMKLTEENPLVATWASAYSRIVIYPSRSLASITDPEERAQEEQRSRAINMASMRALDNARRNGNVVLVFPAGTRYRKGKPETKRGVREIDSYVRLFDIMLPIAINGNCLRISDKDPNNMLADEVWHDKIIYTVGAPIDCKSFRKDVQANLPQDLEDKKQPVVDAIMAILENLHQETEKTRQIDWTTL